MLHKSTVMNINADTFFVCELGWSNNIYQKTQTTWAIFYL